MRIRNIILWLNAVLILVIASVLIYQKEQLIENGQSVLLRLAPVDPRSLIQGDYMRLRYEISGMVDDDTNQRDGFAVVRTDPDGIVKYVRVHESDIPVGEDEILLRFRHRTFDVRIGPESFFFQEGHAKYYDDACYGELKVNNSGDVLLVGLRGCDLESLGPSSLGDDEA